MSLTTSPSSPEGFSFAVKDANGVLVAADSLPTCVLKRIFTSAGVRTITEAAATVIVVPQPTTGLYFATWTNGAWTEGDQLQLYATAVVGGLPYTSMVAVFEVVGGGGAATLANQVTMLARLGAFTGTGLNTVLGFLRALGAKAAALTPTDLSTGTTFDNTTDSQEAIRDALAGILSQAIAAAGIDTTITGMPDYLRRGDARTVANGYAIPIRLYNTEDPPALLLGIGSLLFEDATITFGLRGTGCDSPSIDIACTWVESGADGYVRIAYDADALDALDAMDAIDEGSEHRWGLKFQWGDDDAITLLSGTIPILSEIAETP